MKWFERFDYDEGEEGADRHNPDEEEGVERKDDEHGHLHHPQVASFIIHEEAGRFLKYGFLMVQFVIQVI